MTRGVKNLIIFASVLVVGLAAFYFGMAYYYSHPGTYIGEDGNTYKSEANQKCFLYGTYIDDVYCTGMTKEQVAEVLSNKYKISDIDIEFENQTHKISLDDINYTVDFGAMLDDILAKQNVFLWPKMLVKGNVYSNIEPTVTYDNEALASLIEKIGIKENNTKRKEACIELTDDGYVFNSDTTPILKADLAKAFILDEVANGNSSIVIDDSFYDDYKLSKKEEDLAKYFEKIDSFQNRYVAYLFGKEKKVISKNDWAILLNTETVLKRIDCSMIDTPRISFEIDEEKAVQFIDEFLDEYNTLNNKYFNTHSGAVVYVQKGIYGNKIDVAREEKWFKEFINSNETRVTRAPVYLHEAKYKEKNDFGDTYVEISIDEQHMWYYVDGKVFVETDITSGGPAVGGTYPRVCYIQNKIPNKWLNGPTWHVFVKYWMAIDGSIGIHDSSWREVYGGTEYKTNGSHGCINTPFEAMQKIYDNIEVGTPVIVYSVEKNGVDRKN